MFEVVLPKLSGTLHTASSGAHKLMCRVKSLESQISELEAESSRLLRALDSMKEAKAESERELKKKVGDSGKENSSLTTEIEVLKSKVKQFGDYDEIKRELEIMKASLASVLSFETLLMPVCRVLRSRL